jgi:hypothetical protein
MTTLPICIYPGLKIRARSADRRHGLKTRPPIAGLAYIVFEDLALARSAIAFRNSRSKS